METKIVVFNEQTPTLLGEQKNHTRSQKPALTGSPLTVYTDWIEFTAWKTSFTDFSKLKEFSLELRETGTAQFKELYYIMYKGEKIASLENLPRPRFLDPELVRIKLENDLNYRRDCYQVVKDLIEAFELKFKNYTRIDFALDFQEVNGFSSPQAFLQQISEGKIRMKGRKTETFKELTTYSDNLAIWRDCKEITGCAFGKRISGMRTVIYNKTKELRRVKDKPYIREAWKQKGFDEKKDVYRIEFSCKNPRSRAMNFEQVSAEFLEDWQLDYLGLSREEIKPGSTFIAPSGETLPSFDSMELLNKVNDYTAFLIQNNLFYKTVKKKTRITRLKGFSLFFAHQIKYFERIYPVVKAAAKNIKKTILKHLTFEALFQQKHKEKLKAAASWELIKSIASRWQLKEWMYANFEYLGINTQQFSALDYFTGKELESWKFSQGEFKQRNLF